MHFSGTRFSRSFCGVGLLAILPALPSSAPAGDAAAGGSTITIALGGDLIGPIHPMNRAGDPRLQAVARLFLDADVGFANQENSVFDLGSFTGHPAAETGGGYPLRVSAHARDAKDMGLSMVSVANNHATDFGPEGLIATLKSLSAAGLVYGGAGLSEGAARGPAYLDTPKGAVALVATASTFTPSSVAGGPVERHGASSKQRPGISPLHVRKVRLLPPEMFRSLKEIGGPLAMTEGSAIRIGDQLFRQDKDAGTRWEMKPSDEEAILGAVKEADSRAGLVVFSIHAHETAGEDSSRPVPFFPMVLAYANEAASPDDPRPANFEIELFHAAIDRGADVVARHGPHVIGGIEIYNGKPIFYGLGSLFLDFDGAREFDTPDGERIVVPDSWFDSFVPVCTFVSGKLQSITLHPIAIEPARGARSGSPALASGKQAQAILNRLKELSAGFGTSITVTGDLGIVQIPST